MVSLARLKTQDDYSYMHSVAVCALMVALAARSAWTSRLPRAGLAGLMHDLGKAVMPLDMLNKPGKLTDDEFTRHAHAPRARATRCCVEGAVPASARRLPAPPRARRRHGLPARCPATRMTRIARMGAICDVYDAITSNRPYKKGWDPAESIARMASWKGHFDPTLFQAFVKSLGIYPVGSLVRWPRAGWRW
jgi:HD-GYP domain-containing protein (c-di-GMP phosphodiesterase class II)